MRADGDENGTMQKIFTFSGSMAPILASTWSWPPPTGSWAFATEHRGVRPSPGCQQPPPSLFPFPPSPDSEGCLESTAAGRRVAVLPSSSDPWLAGGVGTGKEAPPEPGVWLAAVGGPRAMVSRSDVARWRAIRHAASISSVDDSVDWRGRGEQGRLATAGRVC